MVLGNDLECFAARSERLFGLKELTIMAILSLS
jgi:hypothetical protein